MTPHRLRAALLGLVVMFAVLHLVVPFRLNINWDEYRYLADVYRFHAGTLTAPLQTLHVQLFRWLPSVGANEVDQVLAARTVYYMLFIGSCGLIYLIARRFYEPPAALFAVACVMVYGEVIRFATSFRYDGLALFLLLAALAALLRGRGVISAVSAGVLTVAAFMVTMKSVFYLPTLLFALLFRRWRPQSLEHASKGIARQQVRDIALYAASAVSSFALLYTLHRSSLSAAGVREGGEMIQRAGSKVIVLDQLFPASRYLILTLFNNIIIWLLLLDGVGMIVRRVWRRERVHDALLMASFMLPMGAVLFYRNSFPYFYLFVMPPALVLCGLRFDQLVKKMTASPAPARVLVFLFITAVLVNLSKNYPDVAEDQLVVQRQVINAVHEIFPEPVPYIDRNSMIASFPKVGLFMSTWGMEAYHDAGKPIFEDILRTSAPPFLLANHPALFLDSAVPPLRTLGAYRLMERDVEVLTSNFVHHWGPIYVAGKRALISPVAPITMEVIVPGTYTLESRSSVLVQGVLHQPGDLLRLGQGAYELLGTDTVDVVTLRWGANLKRPAGLAPTGVLYYPLERS